jgi:hypothetical protein
VELGEVMIDEVLLHLLDVREVSGRDLMLLELNITLITIEFEARNDHRIQDQVLFLTPWIRIRDGKKSGSGIREKNIPDPQHWK